MYEKGVSKLIFTSSVAVYGHAPKAVDEYGIINPFNEYSKAKFEAEEIYRSWLESHKGNQLIIVRPTVIFGEGIEECIQFDVPNINGTVPDDRKWQK